MVVGTNYRNPLDPNDYFIWEEQGFEEVYVGLFKIFRPKRKCIGFLTKEFNEDNAALGINVGFANGQFYGTIVLPKILTPSEHLAHGNK